MVIAICMLITMVPTMGTSIKARETSIEKINNPRLLLNQGVAEWDCVYFGKYPQSSDGKGGFKTEPIKWRVISVKDNDAFLMADKALDFKAFDTSGYDSRYNSGAEMPTWERCTLRSWLNGYGSDSNIAGEDFKSSNFIDTAFTSAEKEAIYTSTVDTDTCYNPGTWNKTSDKVYLLNDFHSGHNWNRIGEAESLSVDEMMNRQFDTDYIGRCEATDYTIEKGCKSICDWWYSGPGCTNGSAACKHAIYSKTNYGPMAQKKAIRPVLHLNLSTDTWTSAGTIQSECEKGESTTQNTTTEKETTTEQTDEIPTTTPDIDYSGDLYNVEEYIKGEERSYPKKEGKIFAGWYADKNYKTPYTKSIGEAYAKFIDESILGPVKFQMANDGSAIRFVSSVDNLKYLDCGFIINGSYDGHSINNKKKQAAVLYRSINAGGQRVYPTVFDDDSKWFFAYTVRGLQAGKEMSWNITPYYVTPDGTTVEGIEGKITKSATEEDWKSVTPQPADYYRKVFETATCTEGVWSLNAYDGLGAMSYKGNGKSDDDLSLKIDEPNFNRKSIGGKGIIKYGLSATKWLGEWDYRKTYNYTIRFKSNRAGTAAIWMQHYISYGIYDWPEDTKIVEGENEITGTIKAKGDGCNFIFLPDDLPEGTIIDFEEVSLEEALVPADAPGGFACNEIEDNIIISWCDYDQVNLYVDDEYYGTYNQTIVLPKDSFEPGGHKFEIAGVTDDLFGESEKTESTTVKIDNYKIKYNLEGGIENENPREYTKNSDDIVLKRPTREGYIFNGWTGEGEENALDVTIKKGSKGDKEYTANWVEEGVWTDASKDWKFALTNTEAISYKKKEVTENKFSINLEKSNFASEDFKIRTPKYTITEENLQLETFGVRIKEIGAHTLNGFTINLYKEDGTCLNQGSGIDFISATIGNYNDVPQDISMGWLLKFDNLKVGDVIYAEAILNCTTFGTKEIYAGFGPEYTDSVDCKIIPPVDDSYKPIGKDGWKYYFANTDDDMAMYRSTFDEHLDYKGGTSWSDLPYFEVTPRYGNYIFYDLHEYHTCFRAQFNLLSPSYIAKSSGYHRIEFRVNTFSHLKYGKTSRGIEVLNGNGEVIASSDTISNNGENDDTFICECYVNKGEKIYIRYNHSIPRHTVEDVSEKWKYHSNNIEVKSVEISKLNKYKIDYDLDGGYLVDGNTNPTNYFSSDDDFYLNNPCKDGFKFVGWTGTDFPEPTKYVLIQKGSEGDRHYKANWKAINNEYRKVKDGDESVGVWHVHDSTPEADSWSRGEIMYAGDGEDFSDFKVKVSKYESGTPHFKEFVYYYVPNLETGKEYNVEFRFTSNMDEEIYMESQVIDGKDLQVKKGENIVRYRISNGSSRILFDFMHVYEGFEIDFKSIKVTEIEDLDEDTDGDINVPSPSDFSAYNYVDNDDVYKLKFRPGEGIDKYKLYVDYDDNELKTISTSGLDLDEKGFFTLDLPANEFEDYTDGKVHSLYLRSINKSESISKTVKTTLRLTKKQTVDNGIPRIYVVTNTYKAIEKGTKTAASLAVKSEGSEINSVSEYGTIKLRGNSTANAAKKSFNISFDSKQKLMPGAKAGKKWCLLANAFDKSLMRNKLAMDLGKAIGGIAVPEEHFVDLYLDGIYKGNYILSEPADNGRSGVEYDEGNEKNPSKDISFEYDLHGRDSGEVYVNGGTYKTEDLEDLVKEMEKVGINDLSSTILDDNSEFMKAHPEYKWQADKFKALNTTISEFNKSLDNPSSDKALEYIDMDSFTSMYIVAELFKVVDFGYSSVKFYVTYDGNKPTIHAGALWDYDLSSGNSGSGNPTVDPKAAEERGMDTTEGFRCQDVNYWFGQLMKNPTFKKEVIQKYKKNDTIIQNLYKSNDKGESLITQNYSLIKKSVEANYKPNDEGGAGWSVDWRDSGDQYEIFGSIYHYSYDPRDKDYNAHLDFLKNWLEKRHKWLMGQWENSN